MGPVACVCGLGKARIGEGGRRRGQVPRNSQLFPGREGGRAGSLWRGEGMGRSKGASSAGLGRGRDGHGSFAMEAWGWGS